MKILITGVAGFVGSKLAERLIAEGHFVVGLDNMSIGTWDNIKSMSANDSFRFYEMNILHDEVKSVLQEHKPDLIIHLASYKIPRMGNTFGTLKNNCLGTYSILRKSGDTPCIVASTSDVYGKMTDIPFKETQDLKLGSPEHRRWVYALSKLYEENVAIAFWEKYKKPYNIIRFFNIYGENVALDWTGGAIPEFIQRALKNEQLEIHGDGEQTRCFTYIDDVIDALMLLINSNVQNEILNIGNKDMISVNNLAMKIIELTGAKKRVKYIPYSSFFGKYEDVVTRKPDVSKAQRLLGWIPMTSLDDGLKKTIQWIKEKVK